MRYCYFSNFTAMENQMKKIKRLILLTFFSVTALTMVACSDDETQQKVQNESSADHVWKQQTDTLKASKDAAKKLQQSLDQQQKQMDESN